MVSRPTLYAALVGAAVAAAAGAVAVARWFHVPADEHGLWLERP
jgi:hypothetical protein